MALGDRSVVERSPCAVAAGGATEPPTRGSAAVSPRDSLRMNRNRCAQAAGRAEERPAGAVSGAGPCRPSRGSPVDQRAPRSALAGSWAVGEPASPVRACQRERRCRQTCTAPRPGGIDRNRRRGREGARVIQTIPEARPRPTGGAGGSGGTERPPRRAVGGAPEHRPSVSLLVANEVDRMAPVPLYNTPKPTRSVLGKEIRPGA